jgi:hypothetical protein
MKALPTKFFNTEDTTLFPLLLSCITIKKGFGYSTIYLGLGSYPRSSKLRINWKSPYNKIPILAKEWMN